MTNKKAMEHKASETHIEIVNYEEDALFSTTISCKGSDDGISTPRTTPVNFIYDNEDDDESRKKRRKTRDKKSSNFDTPNSMEPETFVCEICVDDMSASESFGVQNCSHSYCRDCIKNYVASKLQENITSINCPVHDCRGSLDPEYCRPMLPCEVVERWESALPETMIVGSQRFYCPFKDCSIMLIEDGTQVVAESQCPNCKRMFCAQCKVPWHTEIECEEFQKLNENELEKEDIMLRSLARKRHWSRCPKCRFYVERTRGCDSIRCWCGTCFSYGTEQI